MDRQHLAYVVGAIATVTSVNQELECQKMMAP